MHESKLTIRSRELGEALRHAMERANLNGKRAAALLGWSESHVSRLLTGKLGATEVDVSAFLAVCGIKGRDRGRLLRLAREQDSPGWLQQHGSRLPKQVRTLIDHEHKAVEISEFEPNFIPGLLQTGEYSRAVISRGATIPGEEVDDRVAARLARQSLFSRERPANFTFVMHELAFHLPVGGRAVMSEQLHHLLRMSVRSYISIRVIPTVFGAHAGTSGSCRLMEFTDFKPVVYLEGETSGLFLEDYAEITAYRNVFGALQACALDEAQSKELIAALAIDLYAGGEDHDDRG